MRWKMEKQSTQFAKVNSITDCLYYLILGSRLSECKNFAEGLYMNR